MVECSQCHAQIPNGSRFCPNCGTQFSYHVDKDTGQVTFYDNQTIYPSQTITQPQKAKRGCLHKILVAIGIIAIILILIELFYDPSMSKKAKREVDVNYSRNDSQYATDITYDMLARTPDDYKGKALSLSGTIIQVIEEDNETNYRVAVDDDYNKIIFVTVEKEHINGRLLEDDKITIKGVSVGTTTYKSALGTKITIPWIMGEKVNQK